MELGNLAEYMKRAAELGQKAICVSEHGSMASAYEFQRAKVMSIGIKTIIGNEMYVLRIDFVKA